MERLSGEQIVEAIKEYIQRAPYNYAVMIDGEWGCGKSHFVKNTLTDVIETIPYGQKDADGNSSETNKHKVIAISLYGISDIATLARQISISLLYLQGAFHTRRWKFANFFRRKPKKFVGKGKVLIGTALGMAANALEGKLPGFSADIIQQLCDLKRFVFIFDDLERSRIPIEEMFGFIGNLVEINDAKVIVVANEKELKSSLNSEKEYRRIVGLASISDKVIFPKVSTVEEELNQLVNPADQGDCGFQKKGNERIDFEYLKLLGNKFFPHKDYERIKEKVVGRTFFFEADLQNVISALAKATLKGIRYKHDGVRYSYDEMEASILQAMQNEKYHNLRTVQMLLAYLARLLPIFLPVIKEQFDSRNVVVFRKFVYNIAVIAIRHSKGMNYDDANPSDGSAQTEVRYLFAMDYFYNGRFSEEETRVSARAIVFAAWQDHNEVDNPIVRISQWWIMTETEIQDCLKELHRGFENRRWHDEQAYLKILTRLLELNEIDVVTIAEINGIVEEMCKTARDFKLELSDFVAKIFAPSEKQQLERYSNFVARINRAGGRGDIAMLKVWILKALGQGAFFSEAVLNYYRQNDDLGNDKDSYILLADLNVMLSLLKKLPAKDIYDFRCFLSRVYRNFEPARYSRSEGVLRRFEQALSEILLGSQFYDKIAKANLKWICYDMRRLLKKYSSQGEIEDRG